MSEIPIEPESNFSHSFDSINEMPIALPFGKKGQVLFVKGLHEYW
jgi:hypothetical protein